MDSDRLQHGVDVHGAVLRLFGRSSRDETGAPFFSRCLRPHLGTLAVFSQPDSVAFSSRDLWAVVRNILPTNPELRVAQPADEFRDLCSRRLLHRYPRRVNVGDAARRLVHGTLILAMDLLEWSTARAIDDAVYLPRDSKSSPAVGNPAQGELARLPLRERRTQSAFRRPRSGPAIGLVSFRGDRRNDGARCVPARCGWNSPLGNAKPIL